MNVCILIRVYNRIDDLLCNISIIKNTWKSFNYDILVTANGAKQGYHIPENIDKSVSIVEVTENAGHLKGNSQLLLEGYKHINFKKYDYIIILEADTWIYGDKIIRKYIERMNNSTAVWSSALWYDRFYSLATDFAIIKSSFLEKNKKIFDFSDFPECYVCNYLINNGYDYILIKENMPVQIPSYIRGLPYAPYGRFYIFPSSKMITYHIEHIHGGMESKKSYFNLISGIKYFDSLYHRHFIEKAMIKFMVYITYLLPKRTWYSKRKQFHF